MRKVDARGGNKKKKGMVKLKKEKGALLRKKEGANDYQSWERKRRKTIAGLSLSRWGLLSPIKSVGTMDIPGKAN